MMAAFVDRRLAKLRAFMRDHDHDAALITKPANVQYFSGFRGDDTALVITARTAQLVTDARYTEQAKQQAPDCKLVEQRTGLWPMVARLLRRGRRRRVIIEGSQLPFDTVAKLTDLLPLCEFTSLPLDRLRVLKDDSELAQIRRACAIADAAFADVVSHIKAGVSEREVAMRLEMTMRRLGSERPAFETIVASGARGALPHGAATDKRLARGEFVTMDFGATVGGYCSDITRTVAVGAVSAEQRRVYEAVRQAQALGVNAVKANAVPRAVDAAVRQCLKDAGGYDTHFTHGLGHSVGLEIHEEPRLSAKSDCDALLPGMVVTVEPGVYLAGKFGLRIEDTVVVAADGCERLTTSDRSLLVL